MEITGSQSGRPRRLNLYDKVDNFTYNERYKCSVQDGFSYTLSFTPPIFYGGRCLDEYPAIATLKVNIWKKVFHWLSPLSKLCPPNGVQCLLYIADFNGFIRPHRDMSPSMNVDTKTNSQIIGSSVIVVSFFDSQMIRLGTLDGNQKFVDHDVFSTDHCSVHVLDPSDDSLYHHTNKFETMRTRMVNRPTRIRLALTFRWLGNRKQFFGPDNKSGLEYCQVEARPLEFIRRKWRKSPPTQRMWMEGSN